MRAMLPENMPDIRYYASREGQLIPLIAGSIPEAVAHPPLLVGLLIDGHIHPIFDYRGRWIMVNIHTREIIPVTLHLYNTYGSDFPGHILAKLAYNNDGELYMPLSGHSNVEPIHERNVRQRHN